MSLTTANLHAALQRRGPRSRADRHDQYWWPPPIVVWRTPVELFVSATLYGIAITLLLAALGAWFA